MLFLSLRLTITATVHGAAVPLGTALPMALMGTAILDASLTKKDATVSKQRLPSTRMASCFPCHVQPLLLVAMARGRRWGRMPILGSQDQTLDRVAVPSKRKIRREAL